MAPEVIKRKYNEKCDVWSIGCILYVMLTGFPPFNGTEDAEIIAKVSLGKYSLKTLEEGEFSEQCIAFIQKLLTFDPEERISAEEALRDPWILDNLNKRYTDIDLETKKIAMLQISKFKTGKRLQQATIKYIVERLASPEEIHQLE